MSAPAFAPGDPVEVTSGLAKGQRGIVQAPVDWRFGSEPQWRVKIEGRAMTSVLRQDFLRKLEAS